MANDIKTHGGSLSITLLLIAFIVLKLTNVISWSWWWVLSPLWLPWAIALVVIIVYAILIFCEK